MKAETSIRMIDSMKKVGFNIQLSEEISEEIKKELLG